MSLHLEFFEDTARFCYPPEHDKCLEEFQRLLDRHRSGQIGEKRCIDALQGLAERHPWFVDAHAHIGNVLLEGGKPKRAHDAYLAGFSICEAAIPPGYADLIEWNCLDNRPFFRAAHGLVLCHLHLGAWNEAVDQMNAMLVWNPRDNQGIRCLLGSALLRAGRLDEARALLVEFRHEEPSLQYELGLLRLVEGEHVAAATCLRHGFVENRYIAEMICGTPDPLPVPMWHGSNFAEPDCAKSYVKLFGDLWKETPDAVAFVRWLHTHPKVMEERAAIFECREALLWKRDAEVRSTVADRLRFLTESIDGSLSDTIVVERIDMHGVRTWPWLHHSLQA